MELSEILQLSLLFICLLLSAFFSGSETAFFSLNSLEKDLLKKKSTGKKAKFLSRMLEHPEQLLITILTGNMFVNFLFASVVDRVVEHRIPVNPSLYSIIISTFFVLIFGEMIPKNISIRHARPVTALMLPFLNFLHAAFTPIRFVLMGIERGIITFLTGKIPLEEEDIHVVMKSALNMGYQKGIVHPSELSVFESFFNFREKTANEIMIPRTRVISVELSTKLEDVIHIARQHHEEVLFPVYKKDIDHIVGYIDIQDILVYRFQLMNKPRINEILKPTHPVPQTKNLVELMQEMIQTGKKMAVVIDEYGGTAGIINFEHLIEDFLNFFYNISEPDWIKISKDVYTLPGRVKVEKLSKLLNIELKTESKTLSGLLIERLGEIPEVGTNIRIDHHTFTVKRVSRKSIQEVMVKKSS
jgi:CBS domain containing-hemolysin-like protein